LAEGGGVTENLGDYLDEVARDHARALGSVMIEAGCTYSPARDQFRRAESGSDLKPDEVLVDEALVSEQLDRWAASIRPKLARSLRSSIAATAASN
jgi:hypothetical protein